MDEVESIAAFDVVIAVSNLVACLQSVAEAASTLAELGYGSAAVRLVAVDAFDSSVALLTDLVDITTHNELCAPIDFAEAEAS